jgi:hypothetical protein
MEEEQRDKLYVSLASSLSKGQINLNTIQDHLDSIGLSRWAQAEDVKIQLRAALMWSQISGPYSGVCSALASTIQG